MSVYIVLGEDSYETRFGDGYYGYFKGAFFTRDKAEEFLRTPPPGFDSYHIKTIALRLNGKAFVIETNTLSPSDTVCVEDVVTGLTLDVV